MKANNTKLCVFFVIVFFLHGCASTPQKISSFNPSVPPEGKSIVYIYRPPHWQVKSEIPSILDNEHFVINLANGKYVEYVSDAGRHEFRTDTTIIDEPVTLLITAGETYYLRLKFREGDWPNTMFTSKWIITRIHPVQAVNEIQLCEKVYY